MATAIQSHWLRSGGPDTCCLCGSPITSGQATEGVWSQFITDEGDAPVHVHRAHRDCARMLADDEAERRK